MGIEGIGSVVNNTYQGSRVTEPVKTAPQVSEAAETTASSVANEVPVVAEIGRTYGEQNATNGDATKSQSERIKKAVDEINKNSMNQEAVFGIHDATNRVTIKIVDKTTHKVIKEFPPEKTLDMIAKVWEMAGIMVDERR